ncbi:MAG: biotin transporter BioY [Chloroflexi bacterium]|nr:biotin transporter BioY [Chloroflexota bacterium]
MTTLAPTLSTRYFPRASSWLRNLGLIVTGSLLMAALAQVSIPLPFTPVPITGQTFGVLLTGAAFGSKRGAASMILYLLEGAIGLPFFAGGASGWHIIVGATAGYLIGFIVAAYVIGVLAERGLERSVRTSFVPFFVGTLIIYLFGVTWLAIVLGSLSKAVAAGLLPFLIGDVIKLILAAAVLPATWKIAK